MLSLTWGGKWRIDILGYPGLIEKLPISTEDFKEYLLKRHRRKAFTFLNALFLSIYPARPIFKANGMYHLHPC